MNQNKLSFESENLVVDYISFKFQESHCDQNKIAKYLFNLGFNSYQQSGKLSKPVQERMLVKSKNQFAILFVNDHSYWKGTLLQFSGLNASQFYFLAKQNIIDWKIFDTVTLSRFDIYYSRENNKQDKISSADFLENCYKKIKQTNKNVTLEKNRLGLILKIGNRRSNNYSRIYETKNSLKFEYEMKGKSLEKSYNLLVLNNFEEMELILTKRFLSYFGKLLPLQSSYLDWLVFKLRPIRKQNNFQLGLNSDYIQSEIALNSKTLIQFIQFLNYAQNLDYTIANWDGVYYRKVTFIVRDFITYQNPTISSTNRYKLKKTKEFFRDLLTGAVIDSFQSDCFRTLIAIPRIEYEICPKQKYLIANVWMVNELFYYSYPFYFPNFFNTKLTKDQFEVRFKFIQVFSSINIEKVFWVQEFISSKVSNQRKTTIKKYFIEVIQLLQKYDLIENNYKYISQGNVYKTPKLDVKNISEGFILYEKLVI